MKMSTLLAGTAGILLCACSQTETASTSVVAPVAPPLPPVAGAGMAITTGAGPYSGPETTYHTLPPSTPNLPTTAVANTIATLPVGYVKVIRPDGVYYSVNGTYYKKKGRTYVAVPTPR